MAELVTLNPQLQNNPNYIRIGDTLTVHAAWITAVQQQNLPAPSVPTPQPEPSQPSVPYPLFLPPPSPYLYLAGPVPEDAGTSGNFLDDLRHALSAGAEPTNFMVDLVTDAAGYWRGIEVLKPSWGLGIDALSQLAADADLDLCPAQRVCRATIGGFEGWAISATSQGLSIKASVAAFGVTLPLGAATPWLPPVATAGAYFGVYIPTNLGLSYVADRANEWVFGVVKLRPEDDTSWWCAP